MRLLWSRPARDDVFAIADYYDAIDPDLAESIVDRIDGAASTLLANPHIGRPLMTLDVRKWNVRHTPFVLLYAVRGNDIEIRRVRHGAADWLAE
ncbi:MAG: type II toxin-antitoxin system RelE/ParE family toxin [Pseudomonadota bacterium]